MDRAVFIHNTLRDFVSHIAFRVADDDIVVCHEKRIADLALCAERFTGAGGAEDQTIGILQLFSVHHDEVVGQGVQAVVQALFAAIKKFLRGKGHKDGRAAGGQATLNLDLAVRQRQAAHQALLLLEIKAAQFAVVLLRNGTGLKNIIFQFLLGFAGVQDKECHQKHSFILRLQFFQQSLCITAIGRKIGRQHVHIVPGAHCFFLVE